MRPIKRVPEATLFFYSSKIWGFLREGRSAVGIFLVLYDYIGTNTDFAKLHGLASVVLIQAFINFHTLCMLGTKDVVGSSKHRLVADKISMEFWCAGSKFIKF